MDEINLVAVERIANSIGDAVAGLFDGLDGKDITSAFAVVQSLFGAGEAKAELADLNKEEKLYLVDLVALQVKKALMVKG